MTYKFVDHSWYKPINYSFSKFRGKEFIKDYFNERHDILNFVKKKLKIDSALKKEIIHSETSHILDGIYVNLLETNKLSDSLFFFIRKFEITKLVYDSYDSESLLGKGNCENLLNYVLLAICASESFGISDKLQYLNATLKLNDIVSSKVKEIDNKNLILYTKKSIEKELTHVERLIYG